MNVLLLEIPEHIARTAGTRGRERDVRKLLSRQPELTDEQVVERVRGVTVEQVRSWR
jgi:hypothetical protein